jgi:RHH-type transcriptional regulator, rel operon repressor / antitoxin RelB
MSSTMTIRLEPSIKARLEQLADATHRSKSFLAAEAIREFVDLNEWQINEIKAAISEADAEEFASDDDVKNLKDKWTNNGK